MERLSFTVFADGRFWAIKALLTYGDIKLLEGFLEIIDAEFGDMFQGAGLKRVGATESGEFIECSYRNSTTGLVRQRKFRSRFHSLPADVSCKDRRLYDERRRIGKYWT